MSSVVVSGDVSGAITLAAPSVAGTNTITLPAATGTALTTAGGQTISGTTTVSTLNATTIQVGGNLAVNGPAFSAYMSASQTITLNTETKLALDTKTFDTNTNYNTSLYRFTPTVAGYYQINWTMGGSASTTFTRIYSAVYKNGSAYQYSGIISATLSNALNSYVTGSCVISMNGSTDYLEIYGYINGTGTASIVGSPAYNTSFSGSLIRGA